MKPSAMAPSVRVLSDPWKMLASMDANTHSIVRELCTSSFTNRKRFDLRNLLYVSKVTELRDHVLSAKPNQDRAQGLI